MINVTFVCLGNICRSPMAELILKDIVEKRGLSRSFHITSCATSNEEVGNPVYPPAARELARHGIYGTHRARRITKDDISENDYILVMDSNNLANVLRLAEGANAKKVFKLCSFTQNPRDVSDPWYTRDFEKAFEDISDGCNAFLEYLLREKKELF